MAKKQLMFQGMALDLDTALLNWHEARYRVAQMHRTRKQIGRDLKEATEELLQLEDAIANAVDPTVHNANGETD